MAPHALNMDIANIKNICYLIGCKQYNNGRIVLNIVLNIVIYDTKTAACDFCGAKQQKFIDYK